LIPFGTGEDESDREPHRDEQVCHKPTKDVTRLKRIRIQGDQREHEPDRKENEQVLNLAAGCLDEDQITQGEQTA
jgi:hypothetical protein